MSKKVAVVGAGIFGITVALQLALKHEVDLFEKNSDILLGASGANQFRLHRGYHYPRSIETILSSLAAVPSFRKEFGEALVDSVEHYYCIAKEKSLVSVDQYLTVLEQANLEYQKVTLNLVDQDKVGLTIKVSESLIDPAMLREVCYRKLKKSSVKLLLNTTATSKLLSSYDMVVLCTYSQNNTMMPFESESKVEYQFELCEKIVVELPPQFANTSLVVMDGPFMCFDPYGKTGYFLLGNVVEAIHQSNIGVAPLVGKKYGKLLNTGIQVVPELSRFESFIASGAEFVPDLKDAAYRGSFFTVRTVLPYKDTTDERPTLVKKVDEKMITVFSGKLANCVQAAEQVMALV